MPSPEVARLLYITIDGILGHLGYSQVIRVVEGLRGLGHRYEIVSLERESDLANTDRVRWLEEKLAARDIRWRWDRYEQGGGAAVGCNELRLARLAARAAWERRVTHVHARGYHSALVAMGLGRPWLFDARGYWIDERVGEGRWFTTPARLALARALERRMYRSASRVVSLTELQAADVRAMRPHAAPETSIAIPTCADYDDFHPAAAGEQPSDPILGIVGSANSSYLVPETAALAAEVTRRSPRAHIRVISADRAVWRAALEGAGVEPHRIQATQATHEHMPQRLRELSWVLLLLTPPTVAKRGSMPTKLAECFASGVRVCAYGCNEEVEDWVRRAEGGCVLESVTGSALESASQLIVEADRGPNLRARALTAPHFSLESGVARYSEMLQAWTNPS